ncbi:hypothetical protein Kfla_1766 [Kribbella flavida DSM 17836]|uniref:Uncharacterized protein n=1 Tax=Kribbella flavida (strain DSM 17836 / JCM 10339 / NBRC 14399) TaxID=479435 RepID=D2PNK9_KRIFD|nr:hypothetical protein [Kribbella flavida]ADB30861.1 hypothetical protein Kfla_1766 [Kribbella flavida DSM 17836]
MTALLVTLHLGGVPEAAMVLGPVLLIAAFLRIARRNDAVTVDEEDWDANLGDFGDGDANDPGQAGQRTDSRVRSR